MAKRKDNGEGSIYRLKDGRYMGRIQFGLKGDGKPNRKSVYGHTESEVKRKLRELKKEYEANGGHDVTRKTVAVWFTEWLETKRLVGGWKPKTYASAERAVKKFIIPYLGFMQVKAVTSSDVQNLINQMLTRKVDGVIKPYSYSQINRVIVTMSQRYKDGIVAREVLYNPADKRALSMPRDTKKPILFLTKEEAIRFVEVAQSRYKSGTLIAPNAPYLELLLYTGMRVGEALALEWTDIDYVNKQIHISKNVVTTPIPNATGQKKNITTVQDTPKTSTSNRYIPMSAYAEDCLKRIQALRPEFSRVLTTDTGNYVDVGNLERTLDGILKRADIKRITLHGLRHTFATLLLNEGEDVKVVSELLGHSDVTVTYNTYIHVIQAQKAKAVSRLDGMLTV